MYDSVRTSPIFKLPSFCSITYGSLSPIPRAVILFLLMPFSVKYLTHSSALFCDNLLFCMLLPIKSVCDFNSILTSGLSLSVVTSMSKSCLDFSLKSNLAKSYSILGKIISFFTGSRSKSTSIVLSFSIPCVVSVLIFFKNSFLKAMIS